MVITVAFGLWLQTYKAFTQEKLVAVVKTTAIKEDDHKNPYFKIVYTPIDEPSALSRIFVKNNDKAKEAINERVEYYINGDRFMVESEVVKFQNWATLLGFKTIYKVTRIRGEYTDIDKEKDGKRSIFDINGGIDPGWETLEYNQESLSGLVESIYGSSASQSARPQEKSWGLYMTEDGLIMKSFGE